MASIEWTDDDTLWMADDGNQRRMIVTRHSVDGKHVAVFGMAFPGQPAKPMPITREQAQAIAQALMKFSRLAETQRPGLGAETELGSHPSGPED